jgi:hypothetical protein
LYYCSDKGFDIHEAPCADPVTGLFISFGLRQEVSAVECWDLWTDPDAFNVDTSSFAPYCDRNASHINTRGDCVFQCKAKFENCNGRAEDGCEANITQDQNCDNACVDCVALSGVERTIPPKCIVDASRPGHYKCNYTCPGTAQNPVNCVDQDGKWENGCEVATNGDIDYAGVFMNENDNMDCSIMQAEARKNPWLFRHHLHIDLTKPVPTTIGRNLPAGSIFCDNNLAATSVSGGVNGKCIFMCIDGFINANRRSWDGCEGIANPHWAYPVNSGYDGTAVPTSNDEKSRCLVNPASPPYHCYLYGGFWIGDPHVEQYMFFLGGASTDVQYTRYITFPTGVLAFNDRTEYNDPVTGDDVGPVSDDSGDVDTILWY